LSSFFKVILDSNEIKKFKKRKFYDECTGFYGMGTSSTPCSREWTWSLWQEVGLQTLFRITEWFRNAIVMMVATI
jgi:hypothetical protein